MAEKKSLFDQVKELGSRVRKDFGKVLDRNVRRPVARAVAKALYPDRRQLSNVELSERKAARARARRAIREQRRARRTQARKTGRKVK